MFNSWEEIFNGTEAPFDNDKHIFSFDGKDVMTDREWWEKNHSFKL